MDAAFREPDVVVEAAICCKTAPAERQPTVTLYGTGTTTPGTLLSTRALGRRGSARLRKTLISATLGVPCACGKSHSLANTIDLPGCLEHNVTDFAVTG